MATATKRRSAPKGKSVAKAAPKKRAATARSTAPKGHKIRIDDALFEYDDATQDVVIKRELIDVWKGNPGKAGECMNAQCIIRNKRAFPHKVMAVSVIKSRVFVVDSLDHAVRYFLSKKDSDLIAMHDEAAIGQPGTLKLRAPKGTSAKGQRHASGRNNNSTTGKTTGRNTKRLARGEKARLHAAVGAA